MNIRAKLIGDEEERAVSPVIGVILMVAITVILAAVIAAFVLDIGDLDEGAPNAQYDWESQSDNRQVAISQTSGDDIDPDSLSVRVTVNGTSQSGELERDGADFTAGEEISFTINGNNVEVRGDVITDLDLTYSSISGSDEIEEVVVTWNSDSTSSIIADHEP